MFGKKLIITAAFTAFLTASQAFGQQIDSIVGKIIKIDLESGVIAIESGSVSKQDFLDAKLDADLIWADLVENGYIDADGTIEIPFYALDKFNKMQLSKKLNSRKKIIYNIIAKSLQGHATMLFNMELNSDLLRGSHTIASLEIEQGDPVMIKYDTGSRNIIRLIDNKSDDPST